MAGTTNLTIFIKANVDQAQKVVAQLHKQLRDLVAGLPKGASPASGSSRIASDVQKSIVAPIQQAQKEIARANKETESWIITLSKLRESHRLATGLGKTRIAEGNVKDMYRVVDAERKKLASQGGTGDPRKYANLEKAYKEIVNLTRKDQLLQHQAEQTNAALQKQGEIVQATAQSNLKAFHAGQDYSGIGNLKRQLKAVDQDLMNNVRSAQAYDKAINKLMEGMGRLSNVEKGTAVIRRHQGVETRRAAAEVAQYQKELKLAEQHLQRMMEAAQRGGIHVRKRTPGPLDEYERFADKQREKWTQGSAGEGILVHSKKDKDRFIKDMEARGLAVKKARSWMRGYADDVSHMMKMQARWFAGAGIIFGALGALRAAAKGAIEFQKAIKDIGAVTGATERELAKLSSRAIQISLISPQSAVELANAASMLVKAGLEVDQVTGILDDVAKTATISGDSLEAVGGAFSTAIMAWGMSTQDAQKIGDTLAATLNYSRLNIEDLATAYNYVASTSSQFNLSFAETNAALAVFSNLGIRASTMATGFTQFLSTLANPPKDFKEAIEKSGQSFEEFVGILDDDRPDKLARVFKAMADAGFTTSTAFRTLEVRTARLVGAGLNAGSAAFERMNKKIRETKQLTEGFNKAMESTSNKLATFRNQMTAIAIHTFNAILPAVDVLTGALKWLGTSLIYVSKGFETFGHWAIWVSAAVFGGAYALVRFGKELWKLTQVAAASKAVFRTHPLFMGLTALAGVLALVGWLRGAGKDAEEYNKAIDDSAEAQKRMNTEHKKAQKIFEDSEKFAKKYKEGLEKLHSEMKKPFLPTEPFSEWMMQMDAFSQRYNQAVSNIKAGIDDIDESLQKLGKNPDNMGWFDRLFYWGEKRPVERKPEPPPTPYVPSVPFGERPDAATQAEIFSGKGMSQRERLEAQKKAGLQALKYSEAEMAKRAKIINPKMAEESIKQLRQYFSIWRKEAGLTLTFQQREEAIQQNILNLYKQKIAAANKAGEVLTEDKLQAFLDEAKKSFMKSTAPLEKEKREALKAWDDYGKGVAKSLEENSAKDEVKKLWVDARYEIEDQIRQFTDAKVGALGLFGVSREDVLKAYEPAFKALREALETKMKGGVVKLPSFEGAEDLEGVFKILLQLLSDIGKSEDEIRLKRESSQLDMLKDIAGLRNDTETVFLVDEKILENKRQQQLLDLAIIDDVKYREEMERAVNTLHEERLVKLAKERTLKQVEKRRSGYDLTELMGGDASKERRLLDFQVRLNELLLERPDLAKGAEEAYLRMYRAMEWDQLPLKDGFEGFVTALRLGVGEAVKQLGDGFEWAKRIGTDAVNTLQRSSSDFFYNLSTAQGFDPEKHKNFWEYFKDVVDDFLKSVYQSFMRTLSDIWSAWLTNGIVDMLGGVVDIKSLVEAADARAIGTNATLTGTLSAQIGVVTSLTSVYWGLAAAKMAAGMGGFGAGAGAGATSAPSAANNYGGFTDLDLGVFGKYHQGGYIPRYHSGTLSRDERLAILQTGEGVLSRRGVAALGTLNSGRTPSDTGAQSVVNNFNIVAADAKSFTDMVRRNPEAITGVVSKDMGRAGSTRTAMRRYL